jgi:hypothetical protein
VPELLLELDDELESLLLDELLSELLPDEDDVDGDEYDV